MIKILHAVLFIFLVGAGPVLNCGAANAERSPFFGRWTVSDDKPTYTARGKLYKTIDISACGQDFCGVSIDDQNHCGPTLFRFLTIHAKNDQLVGHGLWGSLKKKLEIDHVKPENGASYITLGLGADDMDFSGREGSMPTFLADYKSVGSATCAAR